MPVVSEYNNLYFAADEFNKLVFSSRHFVDYCEWLIFGQPN